MDGMIKVFESNEFGTVRTDMDESGKVLFCASDVATALGYAKPRNAIAAHCKGALKRGILTTGGMQEMTFIPESDVYRLAFSSKLPNAERFTDWVTETVLPSIRQTGGYIAGQESMSDTELMAKALLVAQKQIEERTRQLEEANGKIQTMLPKAELADAISGSPDGILVKQMAHLLTQNGFITGQNRLFSRMRLDGYLCSARGTRFNMPTQDSVERGLMTTRETHFTDKAGVTRIEFVTLITPKGQRYFLRRYAHVVLSDEEIRHMLAEEIAQ